tara:strand:- start:178 stop:462 length:285 start_codon:yes stop_codon:yes gene_type:complete
MAIFELEIADGDIQRVFDAVCGAYGWLENIPNPDFVEGGEEPETIPNPETQGSFVHRKVREFLSSHVDAWEVKQAREASVSGLDTSVNISDPNP